MKTRLIFPIVACFVLLMVAATTVIDLSTQTTGAIANSQFPAGIQNFNTSQQTASTVAATPYYFAGSALSTPITPVNGYVVGTSWVWRVSGMARSAQGTGATSFIVYSGTTGSVSDTPEITQAWGSAGTPAADIAALDVVCTITSIVSTTATVYCGISPTHSLATSGFVNSQVGGYVGTFTFNTSTSGLIFGIGFSVASGGTMPIITVASVHGYAVNLD